MSTNDIVRIDTACFGSFSGEALSQRIDAPGSLRRSRKNGVGWRAEIARFAELNTQTFSCVGASAEQDGWAELAPRDDGNDEGYPASLNVKETRGHVVGVDIGATSLRVALADLNGTVLDRCTVPTNEAPLPANLIEGIRECVGDLLERTSTPRDSVLAIAAGAPGITNPETGTVIATSYLMGWKDVPLRDLLESAFEIPAAVENDVNLAAIGESWIGAARGVRNFVFLAIGTGIGAGIFLNGELFRGAEWTAGEIGYMVVPGTPDHAYEPGEPGSLENVIGGKGIELRWQHECRNDGDLHRRNLTATEIFDRADAGDRQAKRLLDQTSRVLSYAVLNTSLVIDCSLFILGGGVGMSMPLYHATNRILKQRNERTRPHLAQSMLGPDAQLVGAVRLALDKAASLVAIPR